jgi:hypothetical protein
VLYKPLCLLVVLLNLETKLLEIDLTSKGPSKYLDSKAFLLKDSESVLRLEVAELLLDFKDNLKLLMIIILAALTNMNSISAFMILELN